MRVPLWAAASAAAFWSQAGGEEPFPRTLRGPLARGELDVTVKEVPGLCVRAVDRYLAGLGVAGAAGTADRPLRACLVARDGAGFIFLDAGDAPAERTFSLAHELAHFLRHYWEPRRRAARRVGPGAADVFDGRRPATPAERVRALVAGAPLGFFHHLLERGPRRELLRPEVAEAEEDADRLAFELLAPARAVAGRLGARGRHTRARVTRLLEADFGLPPAQADAYADLLVPRRAEDPFLKRLRRGS